MNTDHGLLLRVDDSGVVTVKAVSKVEKEDSGVTWEECSRRNLARGNMWRGFTLVDMVLSLAEDRFAILAVLLASFAALLGPIVAGTSHIEAETSHKAKR